ncbi:MAG: histidinol-phosphate aminotransferase family protein [Bacteroidales bacterium]|nr:histidinol-phosphate aminotransferase family protein [Bacteroidales bacterium]
MYYKTYKFFNQSTRQAMFERVKGYVNKFSSVEVEIQRLKIEYNLDKIYRFDLGENMDGFSPEIKKFLGNITQKDDHFLNLNRYPDVTHDVLKKRIAGKFDISVNWIVLSTGLDSLLDLVTRVFFEDKDIYLMPVPSFFLFEDYSERMGAIPVFMQLKENDNFAWNKECTKKFKDQIIKFRPKIIWISNPNNPTGQIIPRRILKDIIELAYSYHAFVVIDEAYGEYMGISKKFSAAKFLYKFHNIIILRTFSKAYGLAGIRLGYLMCSSSDIIEALLLHRHHFPATHLSLSLADIALQDNNFINQTRKITKERVNKLHKQLDELKSFKYIPTYSNIFMLKNHHLNYFELDNMFKKKGIITSNLNITGIKQNNYVRITIRKEEDNNYFFNVCKEIDNEIKIKT